MQTAAPTREKGPRPARQGNKGRKVTHRRGKTKMKKVPMPALALRYRPKRGPRIEPVIRRLVKDIAR